MLDQSSTQNIPKERTVYVSVPDVDHLIREEHLKKFFSEFGQVESILAKSTNQKKSVYLVFTEPEAVQKVLKHSAPLQINGVPIRVNQYLDMSQLDSEANVVISDLSSSENESTLQKLLSKYGSILSIKVHMDQKKGKGIAYVQFGSKEAADKCLADTSLNLKTSRYQLNKSKYVKERTMFMINGINSHGKTTEQIAMELKAHFSEAALEHINVLQEKHGRDNFQAYVRFKSLEDATQAFKANDKPFNGQKLALTPYIQTNSNNMEQNLYTKNLKSSVTAELLSQTIFNEFAIEVESVQMIPDPKLPQLQRAHIYLKSADDGKKILDQGIKKKAFRALYENDTVFITVLLKKEDRRDFLEVMRSQKETKQQQKGYGYPPQYPVFPYPVPGQYPVYPQMGYNQPYPIQAQPQQGYGGQRAPYYPPQDQGGQQRPYQNRNRNNHQGGHGRNQRSQHQGFNPLNLQQLQVLDKEGNFDKVKQLVGQRIFGQVKAIIGDHKLSSQITGILVDKENYEIPEMVKMTQDPEYLKSQVDEVNRELQQSTSQ